MVNFGGCLLLFTASFVFVDGLKLDKIYSNSTEQRVGVMFSDLAGCIDRMDKIKHMSYEAGSFCRVYSYSCNNLWPENLNSEVQAGIFCILNCYEQNSPLHDVMETRNAYQVYLATVVEPVFSFLMDYWNYVPGGIEATKKLPCKFWGRPNFQDNFQCLIQHVKPALLQMGPADLSQMSSEEGEVLLSKANNITRGLDILKKTSLIMESGGPGGVSKFEMPENPKFTGIKGPIRSSLGRADYANSKEQGFEGPVSKNLRFPWEQVQPGLLMRQVDLSLTDHMAVCNDGANAIMYYKEDSHVKWHFHVDGGFFCYSKKACLGRARSSATLVSTKGWEASKMHSGMFDPHLGGFPNYTHATLGYCSSDAWFGQVDIEDFQMVGGTVLTNGKNGTYFRGYTIMQSVMTFLLKRGMCSEPEHEVFISGCSAGSVASTAQADSFGARLRTLFNKIDPEDFYDWSPGEGGSGAPVHPGKDRKFFMPYIWLLLDGAPIVSPPSKGNYPGELTIVEMAMKLVVQLYGPGRGTSPAEFMNMDCLRKAPDNPSMCVWTRTVLPFIRANNIVLNMYWDNFVTGQLYFYFIPSNVLSYNQGLNAVWMTKEVLKTVSKTQNYWAMSCGDHCISANPSFWRWMPPTAPAPFQNVSARMMTQWTRDGITGEVVADECEHYNCGCMGQNIAMTRMGATALYLEVITWLTGVQQNVPSPVGTAIAADQVKSPAQALQP